MHLPFTPQRLPNISLGVRTSIRKGIGQVPLLMWFFFDLGFDSLPKIGGSLGVGFKPILSHLKTLQFQF
jgi:hypothetical protein